MCNLYLPFVHELPTIAYVLRCMVGISWSQTPNAWGGNLSVWKETTNNS